MFIDLKSLYMRIGKSTRCLPVHKLSIILGETKCSNLEAHIGTDCDWISKLGSTSKALSNMHLLDNLAERILRRNELKKQKSICAKY